MPNRLFESASVENHSPIFLSYILHKYTVKTWLSKMRLGKQCSIKNTAILTTSYL